MVVSRGVCWWRCTGGARLRLLSSARVAFVAVSFAVSWSELSAKLLSYVCALGGIRVVSAAVLLIRVCARGGEMWYLEGRLIYRLSGSSI